MTVWFVLFIHLLGAFPVLATDCDVNELVADVVILLDTSNSIGRTNFGKQIDAVKKLANFFVLNINKLQIGTVTFSSTVKPISELHKYAQHHDDPATLKTNTLLAIDSIANSYEARGTKTAEALKYVIEHSFTKEEGDRPEAPNILIVMTDGASDDKNATLREADSLRRHNITCIPIGIGNRETLSLDELKRMATNESYVYILKSYDALDSFLGTLKNMICNIGIAEMSSKAPRTIVSPSPISTTTTRKQHVKSSHRPTTLPTSTMSIVTTYHRAKNKQHTATHQQQHTTDRNKMTSTEALKAYVTPIPISTTTSTMRQHIVSTHSPTTLPITPFHRTKNKQHITSKEHTTNKLLYDCDVDELVADVVILMDASGSIGRPNFVKQINAVKKLVDFFALNVDKLQIGAVTFSSTVKTELTLNRYARFRDDPTTLKKYTLMAIDYITSNYEAGGTHTADALKFVMEHSFTKGEGDRPEAPNILIVMTDGASDDKILTLQEADNLHRHGITCIPIGIGTNKTLSLDELKRMATNESYVYMLKSYDALDNFLGTLKNIICNIGITLSSSEAPMTTVTPSPIPKITTKTRYLVSTVKPTKLQTPSRNTVAPYHRTKTKQHTTDKQHNTDKQQNDDNEKSDEEYLSDFRSSPAVQAAEVTTLTAVGIIAIGTAICCCKKVCLAGKRRKEDDDDEKKVKQVKEVSPSQSPDGYLNSAKRLNNFMF